MIEEFQLFRRILCVCPHCNEIVRVSDLHLRSKAPAVRTWRDEFDSKVRVLERKEEKFGEMEERLRELARDKGRKESEKVFNRAISSEFKALRYDPFDVKPILNPVDFVVFKGMNKRETVSDIVILCKQCRNPALSSIRKQVDKAVQNNSYDWQVARIDTKGQISFE